MNAPLRRRRRCQRPPGTRPAAARRPPAGRSATAAGSCCAGTRLHRGRRGQRHLQGAARAAQRGGGRGGSRLAAASGGDNVVCRAAGHGRFAGAGCQHRSAFASLNHHRALARARRDAPRPLQAVLAALRERAEDADARAAGLYLLAAAADRAGAGADAAAAAEARSAVAAAGGAQAALDALRAHPSDAAVTEQARCPTSPRRGSLGGASGQHAVPATAGTCAARHPLRGRTVGQGARSRRRLLSCGGCRGGDAAPVSPGAAQAGVATGAHEEVVAAMQRHAHSAVQARADAFASQDSATYHVQGARAPVDQLPLWRGRSSGAAR